MSLCIRHWEEDGIMYRIALKILIGDRAKFIGMVIALSFSAIIIIQQLGIFFGLMRRTYSTITDTPQAHVWIMNQSVKMIDDINPIRNSDLLHIKSIDGVKWAVPFYKGLIRAKLKNGQFQSCNLYGIDGATFIGGPHTMIEGRIEDLRKPFSIIVNDVGANDKLAMDQGPDKPKRPLRVGDELELNDRRAVVVGICKVTRPFRSDPIIYTTFDQALFYAPFERKQLSFILAEPQDNLSAHDLCKRIEQYSELKAFTAKEFEQVTFDYYMEHTGIPINFGIAVMLGLLIGAVITGQIFFNFTTDNLRYFGLCSVVGASRLTLAKMLILQAVYVAFIGWGIGSGLAAFIGFATQATELAFFMPWQLCIGTGALMLIICIASSLISISRIYNIQLSSMFKR